MEGGEEVVYGPDVLGWSRQLNFGGEPFHLNTSVYMAPTRHIISNDISHVLQEVRRSLATCLRNDIEQDGFRQ